MFWFALAGMGLSAYQSGKAASQSNVNNSNAYIDSLKATNAANKAIGEANTSNVIRTGYLVGLQNLQLTRQKEEAAQQGFDLSKAGVAAMSSNAATAAASGTIGSSVDAVAGDIQKKADETQLQYDQSFEEMLENAEISIKQTVANGLDSLKSAIDVNTIAPGQTNALTSSLVSAGGSFLNLYASSRLSLNGNGAGTTSSSSLVAR